ncbi:hypothetical protein HYQ46_012482 [Verticillium longisporum]|nr:hypothetical protein HYQ46_012482 [Verticillium longisporum]
MRSRFGTLGQIAVGIERIRLGGKRLLFLFMYSNNFGVIEVAGAKTKSAPGWAYVPDTGVNPAAAALQPSNRKRARNQAANPSGADLSVRQEAKIRKEVEALDRESNRDAGIPIPPKAGGAKSLNKSTPNTGKRPPQPNQHSKRKAAAAAAAAATVEAEAEASSSSKKSAPSRSRSRRGKVEPAPEPEPAPETPDVEMEDAPTEVPTAPPILTPYEKDPPPAHPGDNDPLLASVLPDLPDAEELRRLLAHPPLKYTEAQAGWSEADRQYPVRRFCEVCGYWGRVRCMKCGTRVCALDCLEVHREECVTRACAAQACADESQGGIVTLGSYVRRQVTPPIYVQV